MSKRRKIQFSVLLIFITASVILFNFYKKEKPLPGEAIDSFNGVEVYYNGNWKNSFGRNTSADGYNLGIKYQCVEFVKRYYYEYYHHEMPNPWGNAVDFFFPNLNDGEFNIERGLFQYKNGSTNKPKVGDIVVFNSTKFNSFGHVAIISKVHKKYIEVVQQNMNTKTREKFKIVFNNGSYHISHKNILGWLSIE